MTTLEERIREFMDATGWSVTKIASIAGVSTSAVSQWIGGGPKEIKTIGNLKAALMLERESGFSALWLARGEGPKMVRQVANSQLGHRVYAVTEVTCLPEPFSQDEFDALPAEQKKDVAEMAAHLVAAFTRYNSPPTGGRGGWKHRRATEEKQAAEGPRSQRDERKRGRK